VIRGSFYLKGGFYALVVILLCYEECSHFVYLECKSLWAFIVTDLR
jgi:hypothetical protein